MNVKLNLIILHIDMLTGTNGCLLDDKQFISRPLLNDDIEGELRDILLEYLEMKVDWVKFCLIDVIAKDGDITIFYGCLIPSILKNKKGAWTNLGDINDRENKRLVFQAGQKTII